MLTWQNVFRSFLSSTAPWRHACGAVGRTGEKTKCLLLKKTTRFLKKTTLVLKKSTLVFSRGL